MLRSVTCKISSGQTARQLSTSVPLLARRTRSHPPLPKPSTQTPQVIVSDPHPLWGFFRNRQSLTSPKDDAKHGRSWTAEELRKKSFDDLHALWIVCLKERNILATQRHERRRQKIRSAGDDEAAQRDRTVRRTMAGIKFVLNERFLAYQEAVELAKEDPTVDLSVATIREPSKIQSTEKQIEAGSEEEKKVGKARKAEEAFRLKAAQRELEKETLPAPAL